MSTTLPDDATTDDVSSRETTSPRDLRDPPRSATDLLSPVIAAATVVARAAASSGSPSPVAAGSRLQRIEESGSSVEAARSLARKPYGGARFRPLASEDGFAYRFASIGDRNVSLRLMTSTSTVVVDVDRLDDYVATWFRDGSTTVSTTRFTLAVPPGQPVVLPSTTPFTLTMQPGKQNLVHVGRSLLDGTATERHGGEAHPIVFSSRRLPAANEMTHWRNVMATATPILIDPESSPLMRMEANLLVARAFLTVFDWDTDTIPPALLKPRLQRVRAGMEFLRDNAHLPVTPADAAAYVGISTRSLQNGFQRHLDLSPTEYLRGVRLDRVRRDLLEHDPETATVSDLARAWGFGNQGRFATAYRARFGEKPNETLRR